MRKILSVLSSTFVLSLFMISSVSAQAEDIHLQETIRQTEAVVQAVDVMTMTQLAQEAARYAVEVKSTYPENKHLQEGLKYLNNVIKKSQAGEAAAARKSAIVALNKFNQIERK